MLSKETKQNLILSLLGLDETKTTSHQVASSMIGKVCMFRTYSAGVHFGELVERDGKECLVKNSRRVFYWSKACSLSQLAMEGSVNISECKIAMEVPELFLSEVIEIIPMGSEAFKWGYEWKEKELLEEKKELNENTSTN